MTHDEFIKWIRTFARKRMCEPCHFIVDGFNAEFCMVLDCTLCEDDPKPGTCDILFEPLYSDDKYANRFCVVSDANKFGVKIMLSALGLENFGDKVKKAYYQ